MSAFSHPDVAHVSAALDTIGQRYRVQLLLRGSLLWFPTMAAALVIGGLLAHASGPGSVAGLALAGIVITALASAAWWGVLPMFRPQRAAWIARLIEGRVSGLHNGLTNALRLAERDDLQSSPFAPLIYAEIREHIDAAPLDRAIQLGELRPVLLKSLAATGVCAVVAVLFWPQVSQGWRQMLSPSGFVPRAGSVQIVGVRPGDTTRIKGQPLEVIFNTTAAPAGAAATATLTLDPPQDGRATIQMPTMATDTYAARIEHVDAPLRYRVEAGGSQSGWFAVKVIDQIKLESLDLIVEPPAYTHAAKQTIAVKNDTPSPINIITGSSVTIVATADTQVPSAMLQLNNDPPLPMKGSTGTSRFEISQSFTADASLSVMLSDASGQLLARLPEPAVALHATADAAPAIELHWPAQDTTAAPGSAPTIRATVRDDFGLTRYRVTMAAADGAAMTAAIDQPLEGQTQFELSAALPLSAAQMKAGASVRVQVEAIDNRNLPQLDPPAGPQVTQSPTYTIRFEDPKSAAKADDESAEKLRKALQQMLKLQQDLLTQTAALKLPNKAAIGGVTQGQTQLRDRMTEVAETFSYSAGDAKVQPTLRLTAKGPAQEAIDLSNTLAGEPVAAQQQKLSADVQSRQRRIIAVLQSLLAVLNASPELIDQKTTKGGDLPMSRETLEQLKAALDAYQKQQQKLLDQTAALPKKPVDDFSDKEKDALKELAMSQDKLSAFMEEKIADFSKLAEQDMSNSSMAKELETLYSEVTMAKNGLNQKAVEMAIPAEEAGLESAKQLDSNIEKWLSNAPDRQNWNMEDPTSKSDLPMPELPKELQDMVGELMEQQEDLAQEMQDANANWADSMNKGIGWDAADGPIADMSAAGVTGNALPNNNEMNGRSGEGRSGKSQGEFVDEKAVGKGGNLTPTRLDPTPFQKGQVDDTSKDPVGGATGGGKNSGQGGEGLEGPTPTGPQAEMKRLAQKQAQIRNAAERLNLQYHLGRYDQFKMAQSIAMMRRVESDLGDNRYQNAMHAKDIALDDLAASRLLAGGQTMDVQTDTTAALGTRLDGKVHDAMKGDLPPAWSDALKAYYQKLSATK